MDTGARSPHILCENTYSDVDESDPAAVANRDELNHMQASLLRLHVQLLNYALERGYAYKRWLTVHNNTLFKDPDNVRIHRTRVIHIYEADYNLMLSVKWRISLYQAEALRELNAGQFGSRPRRNALDPVFIEELQFEISRASRKMMAQTNYDATSCYDRIIQNLAMLISRKFGVHKQVAKSNASTLELTEFRTRTELGVSETGYTHSPEYPIYGTGQGGGNSPQIYCFMSSVMFDCMSRSISQQYIVIQTVLNKWSWPWWDSLMIAMARQIHSCMQSLTLHCQQCYRKFNIMRKRGQIFLERPAEHSNCPNVPIT